MLSSSDVTESTHLVVEYDVMYYKRTFATKIHRDKGSAKFDGVLVVDSATAMVTLRPSCDGKDEDTSEDEEEAEVSKLSWNKRRAMKQKKNEKTNTHRSKVLYSGVQRDISKLLLREDDVIVIGGYEVQIMGLRNNNNRTGAVISQPNKPLTTINKVQPVIGAKRQLVGSTARKVSVPLQSRRATISTTMASVSSSSVTAAVKPTMISATANVRQPQRKQPPAQPQRIPLQSKLPQLASTTKAQPQQPVLPQKRPLHSSKSTIATKQRCSVPPQPLTAGTTTTSTASTTSSVLAHIPLPASIRNVLRPHQVQGVDYIWTTLAAKRGCILGDEMGLGKTLMTIACLTALHRLKREKQFVVVCPSSLVANWANEFDKWLGRASQPKRVVIHKGGTEGLQQIRAYTQKMKQQLMHQPGQVLIVSYDLFRRNSDQFVFPENMSVGLLVVDEGHRLKNNSGSLTLAALESLPSDARLCITATPIQNNLCEFYNLANFCCPGILGTDLAEFRKYYERPIVAANQKNASREQLANGLSTSKELETVSKTFMLRRLQKDVLKTMLPPRREALLFCRPSTRQCQLYRSITKLTVTGNMADALTTLTTLRKICSHPFLHENNTDADSAASDDLALTLSGKLVVLDALLQQIRKVAPDDKVVIVSNFTSALSIIESLVLQPRQLSYSRLDGTTKNRQALIDTFNRTSPEHSFCFLLSSKAGGCGLNIVGANRLVMFDPDWNPGCDAQAMGRIYRPGQTKPCTIYRLFTAGTVEEVIYQRQSQKGGLATLTVDAGTKKGKQKPSDGNAAKFTKEEIADCFTLKENCTCDTKQKVGSRWPAYDDDADGLRALGCTDTPLLLIAESIPDTLRFVHIARDDETLSEVPGDEEAIPSRFADDESSEAESDRYADSDSETEFDL